jgi:hypothetical protein
MYRHNSNFVKQINQVAKTWTAKQYDFMSKMTLDEVIRMAGGKKSKNIE